MDSALMGEKQLNVRLAQPHLQFRTVISVEHCGHIATAYSMSASLIGHGGQAPCFSHRHRDHGYIRELASDSEVARLRMLSGNRRPSSNDR